MASMRENTAPEESILEIAEKVLENVKTIVDELKHSKSPLPGLSSEAPSPDFIPSGNVKLHDLRRQTIEQSRLLATILTGPRKHLMDLFSMPNHQCMSLHIIYHYKIPGLIPLKGSISYKELAEKAGIDEDRLSRILKFLMLYHIFQETDAGQVTHSACSYLLATEQASMDYLGHSYEDVWPACYNQLESFKRSPHGTSELECGMAIALGDNGKKSLFEIYSAQPERMERFSGAMQFINLPGAATAISDDLGIDFDWRGLPEGSKIVDVGGSQGHTARELMSCAPNIKKMIVQDLPEVIEAAKEHHADSRIEFLAASFFEPQPVKDADVYIFRFIFHDWPHERCQEILRNLAPSMKSGARMVVNESIIHEEYDRVDKSAALTSRRADLQMMVALNAKERSVNDWKAMVHETTPDLVFESARRGVVVFRKK